MTCPVCRETMQNLSLDNQDILHCGNCGASFFNDNGINRISFETAKKLSQEKYMRSPKVSEKLDCPRDQVTVVPITNSEAIPRTVTLLQCPVCHGILVSADDLALFKRAQLTKLDYFKAWNMPLGSLRGVFAMGLLIIAGATIYWSYNTLQYGANVKTNAQDLINKVDINKSARYIFISFTTKSAVKSFLVIDNKATHSTTVLPISSNAETVHTVTISTPPSGQDVSYIVTLVDSNGRVLETKKIEFK